MGVDEEAILPNSVDGVTFLVDEGVDDNAHEAMEWTGVWIDMD